ncbi:MAG: alanine racemase [Lactobacillales bacterium]|jgi:alanine racemase|nr:alanine racemase [Lactobacillales bacterium]
MVVGKNRPTKITVNLRNLLSNLRAVHERSGCEHAFAVVKANAYGHGIYEVSSYVREYVEGYCVAILDEALFLRSEITESHEVLVMGIVDAKLASLAARNNVSLTVPSLDWIELALENLSEGETLSVHIKVDTGMNRIGIRDLDELREVINFIEASDKIEIRGVFTHFAKADSLDVTHYEMQKRNFLAALDVFEDLPKYVHSNNSAAAIFDDENDGVTNAARIGIAMYGLDPSNGDVPVPLKLKDTFTLTSEIVQVKELAKGDKISYGCTYEATENEWVATLPIGYADGWIRKLQGGSVLIADGFAEIVGRVCMDQCVIKLPHFYPVGTTVTLIGTKGNARITVDDIAAREETINYEVICLFNERIQREYFR